MPDGYKLHIWQPIRVQKSFHLFMFSFSHWMNTDNIPKVYENYMLWRAMHRFQMCFWVKNKLIFLFHFFLEHFLSILVAIGQDNKTSKWGCSKKQASWYNSMWWVLWYKDAIGIVRPWKRSLNFSWIDLWSLPGGGAGLLGAWKTEDS